MPLYLPLSLYILIQHPLLGDNAYCYMVLARMIYFFLPERQIGIFKPSLLATIFVLLDFGSFIIQIIGSMIASPANPTKQS